MRRCSVPDRSCVRQLSGIDVSAGSLGKMAKLALGRAQTVAILPYPGALDVNTTRRAMPDLGTDQSLSLVAPSPACLTPAPGGSRLPERRLAEPSAMEHLGFGYARRSKERRFSSEGKIKRRREGNASQAPALQCIVLLLCVTFLCGFNFLSVLKNEEGNKHYKKGQVGRAKSAYQDALKGDPKSPVIAFNLGNAYYKEESFKDSVAVYKNAAESEKVPLLQSKAFYNLGNTLYRSKDNEKATEFYKQALRIDPKDQDAKYNLELLTKKSKQDEKKDQDKQKDKQDQKKDQDNQKDQKQDQGGGQGQSEDQKDQKDKKDQESEGGGSEEQDKEGQEPKDKGDKEEKSKGGQGEEQQKDQSGKSEEGEDKDKEGQGKGDEQEEKEDKPGDEQSKGGGQGEEEQKKPDQKEGQSPAGGEEGEEQQPKPTEAQLRAEQILDALGDQEQKIMKMGGNDQKVKRIQRYVDKDW